MPAPAPPPRRVDSHVGSDVPLPARAPGRPQTAWRRGFLRPAGRGWAIGFRVAEPRGAPNESRAPLAKGVSCQESSNGSSSSRTVRGGGARSNKYDVPRPIHAAGPRLSDSSASCVRAGRHRECDHRAGGRPRVAARAGHCRQDGGPDVGQRPAHAGRAAFDSFCASGSERSAKRTSWFCTRRMASANGLTSRSPAAAAAVEGGVPLGGRRRAHRCRRSRRRR